MTPKRKSFRAARLWCEAVNQTRQSTTPKYLVESSKRREELCSTAMPRLCAAASAHAGTISFPRSPLVVAGPCRRFISARRTASRTRLFLLLCCQDDRLHLHTARPAVRPALKTKSRTTRDAPDAATMRDALVTAEQEILTRQTSKCYIAKLHLQMHWKQDGKLYYDEISAESKEGSVRVFH